MSESDPTNTNTDPDPKTPEDGDLTVMPSNLELALFTADGQKRAAFTFVKGGVIIRDDLTEEEWKDGLSLFYWGQHSLKLGLSQYISFGKAKNFKVDAALAQLEFDLPTVRAALDLATVPDEMKHENLTAEHYLVLARADDLSKPKKVSWAKTASEQNLSPTQLKASIAAGEVVSTSAARQQTHGIVSIHGIRQEFEIWLRRVGGLEGILKMEAAIVAEIIGELALIGELRDQLVEAAGKKSAKKKPAAKKAAKKKK